MTPKEWTLWPRMGPLVVRTYLWLGDTPLFPDAEVIWFSYVVLPQ